MVLSSAIIIVVFVLIYRTDVLNDDVLLFEEKSQYTRYYMWLKNLVKHLDIQLKRIGFEAGYLGSHYGCNGVVKMVATGFTVPFLLSQYLFERDEFQVE